MQFQSYLLSMAIEEAFKTYEKIFGGKIEAMLTHEGTPAFMQSPGMAKENSPRSLSIGSAVLMASDAPPGRYSKPQGFSGQHRFERTSRTPKRIFQRAIRRPAVHDALGETFWAYRFGMLTDRFAFPGWSTWKRAGVQDRLDWTAGQSPLKLAIQKNFGRNYSCQRRQHPTGVSKKALWAGARSAPLIVASSLVLDGVR